MKTLPATFQEALKSGYRVIGDSSREPQKGKRTGTVHLKNGSRPELTVSYEADRSGYRFNKPETAI